MTQERISLLILIACAVVVLPACSGEEESPLLHLALQTEPTTVDPAYSVDVSSGMISSLIHANLVAYEPGGELVPDLARSWHVSPDGKRYTFHLGRANFSCGRRVTSHDVLFSLKRLLDPATISPRWWVLRALTGASAYHGGLEWSDSCAEAPDDTTVVLHLERPSIHFLSLLTMPAAGIVCPEEALSRGKDYGRHPCGSGPWRLAQWREGEELILERNPRFVGPMPAVAGISVRVIPEPMTSIAEFEVGNLDILDIPRSELDLWRSAGARFLQAEELRVAYIGLNTTRPPFDDVRVRRALNMAVDVESVIAHVLFGAGVEARGSVPDPLRRWAPPADIYPYDREQAKALLAEAGYPRGFEMEIWQRENPEGGRVLESIQAYLAGIDVHVRLVTREWGAFKQAVDQGTPDAFYLDWFADYPDPENFLMPLFHSSNRGGGGNRARFANALVDSLLDAAALCGSEAERWELYRRAEEIVYREAPWIFLWFPIRYEVVSPRLRGYRMPVIFNGQRYLDVSI
jgi:ABC-type transport system substrate-binding protein